jgi:hypothetical protein
MLHPSSKRVTQAITGGPSVMAETKTRVIHLALSSVEMNSRDKSALIGALAGFQKKGLL